jgi:hypothetical protein
MNNHIRDKLPFLSIGCALLFFAVAAQAAGATVYPLKESANGRYLVDQNDVPYLMTGDSPQALIVNVSEVDAEMFFANREALGFNTVWINLLCTTYTGGRANGSMLDGTLPFTVAGDLSTPNEAYFAHVDRVLNLAADHGLLVLLDPIETGGWLSTMLNNGTNKCRAYGQYLGNRYKNFANIIWMSGNDFQSWETPSNDAVVKAVALGIKDADTNSMHTLELDYFVSSSLDNVNWTSFIHLNATYTYYPTYAQLLTDYNRSGFLANFMVEAHYESENVGGDTGTASVLRRQEYWTLLSGAIGQLYGNHYTWQFISGWKTNLDTPGAIQFGYVKALFEPRRWYDLVPDQNHSVVTAGYGTFASTGSVSGNNYATAARTADGALVIVYLPTIRTVTVDMSKLSAPATARWYDPTSGTYATIAGSPFSNTGSRGFTPTGNNAAGDGDWVLVLESTTTVPLTFRMNSIALQGNNVLLTWTTVGGSTNVVQVANGGAEGGYANNFINLSPQIIPTGTSVTTTNYLDISGATNIPARYYRVWLVP